MVPQGATPRLTSCGSPGFASTQGLTNILPTRREGRKPYRFATSPMRGIGLPCTPVTLVSSFGGVRGWVVFPIYWKEPAGGPAPAGGPGTGPVTLSPLRARQRVPRRGRLGARRPVPGPLEILRRLDSAFIGEIRFGPITATDRWAYHSYR